jgi:hypothetical protein
MKIIQAVLSSGNGAPRRGIAPGSWRRVPAATPGPRTVVKGVMQTPGSEGPPSCFGFCRTGFDSLAEDRKKHINLKVNHLSRRRGGETIALSMPDLFCFQTRCLLLYQRAEREMLVLSHSMPDGKSTSESATRVHTGFVTCLLNWRMFRL